MGSATSSAASAATNSNSGGNITVTKPNYLVWVVIGLAVLLAGIWLIRRK